MLFLLIPFKGQANLSVQALEESETDSTRLALQALHRTLDKMCFNPEDAELDLESLVKVAKINNHAKAQEYQCVLDEVQKHAKSLHQKNPETCHHFIFPCFMFTLVEEARDASS